MAIVEKSFQSDLDQTYEDEDDGREDTYGRESYDREVESRHKRRSRRRDVDDSQDSYSYDEEYERGSYHNSSDSQNYKKSYKSKNQRYQLNKKKS